MAIITNLEDWRIVSEEGWYRIPTDKVPRRWPPQWIAFYHTKVFGDLAFAVRFVCQVTSITEVDRHDLFPDDTDSRKAQRRYFKLSLTPPVELPEPIVSLRLRRLVFIPTTMYKLETAVEINDLYDESPLEDAIWERLKALQIPAERQFYLDHEGMWFSLDFAIFCRDGKIDVETDGDTWHARKERIPEDNHRNNAMAALGWTVLRFNTMQVQERMADYCVPQIVKTINRLGGLDDRDAPPRTYIPSKTGVVQQYGLFESEHDR